MKQSGTSSTATITPVTKIQNGSSSKASLENGASGPSDFWKRANQTFEKQQQQTSNANIGGPGTGEYYATKVSPLERQSTRNTHNAADNYYAGGQRSSQHGVNGSSHGSRDRMNQRLQKIRDEVGSSPI